MELGPLASGGFDRGAGGIDFGGGGTDFGGGTVFGRGGALVASVDGIACDAAGPGRTE